MMRALGRPVVLLACLVTLSLGSVACTSIRDPHAGVGAGAGDDLGGGGDTGGGDGSNGGGAATSAPGATDGGGDTGGDTGGDSGDTGDTGGNGGDTGGGLETIDPNASLVTATPIQVQLAEGASGRYAGFYAADDLGYYDDANLDVLIDPAEPGDDGVKLASASDGPEFYVGPALAVMRARQAGTSDLVNIAQLFQRSGERIASLATSSVALLSDLKGKRVTVLRGGYDNDALAAIAGAGVDRKSVHFSRGAFDADLFAAGASDAAQVRVEDEYARILESANPDTNGLFQPADIHLLDLSTPSLATLEDGIYARAAWLAVPGNTDVAIRFLHAALRGWIDCRGALADCAQSAVDSGADLPAQHQEWVLNESNALIWPSPNGVGMLDPAAWAATAALGIKAGELTAAPTADATRSDLVTQALAGLGSADTNGAGFTKAVVAITAGGQDPEDTSPDASP